MIKSRNKIFKKAAPLLMAYLVLIGGVAGQFNTQPVERPQIVQRQSTQLVSEFASESMAKLYGVDDLLYKNKDGRLVRFDMHGAPVIDVIVDEHSYGVITPNNIQAINQAIDAYNDLFQKINPEYSFRYISKEAYDKAPTKNPCIFITSQLSIKSNNGVPHASTMPPVATHKSSEGELSTNNSFIILGSISLGGLSVAEQQAIIQHEIAHSLGVGGHNAEDKNSIMNPYGAYESIASTKFSADVLYALTAMYYNPQTNPISMIDLNKYITQENNLRNKEIWKLFPSQEMIDQKNSSAFSENLAGIIDTQGTTILNANDLVGKEFSSTNSYGVTTTIRLTDNNTYYFSSTYEGKSITTTGRYRINNNQCVLEGKVAMFDEATKKLYISNIDETRIQYLANGSIVWGQKSTGFSIHTDFNEVDNSMSME